MSVVVVALLVVVALAALLAVGGLLVMDDAQDRLHYTGVATILATVALVAAVVVEVGVSEVAVKALAVGVVVLTSGPVLNHATGRAILTRRHGRPAGDDWKVTG
ncbi:MAG TPA: monovalent cation/H(+) antiporter subunit G [Egibacteraceae bacterium]|nr:monovalent cation/H(+) antiporter subunit G [Egibacteraceae bacterium]